MLNWAWSQSYSWSLTPPNNANFNQQEIPMLDRTQVYPSKPVHFESPEPYETHNNPLSQNYQTQEDNNKQYQINEQQIKLIVEKVLAEQNMKKTKSLSSGFQSTLSESNVESLVRNIMNSNTNLLLNNNGNIDTRLSGFPKQAYNSVNSGAFAFSSSRV